MEPKSSQELIEDVSSNVERKDYPLVIDNGVDGAQTGPSTFSAVEEKQIRRIMRKVDARLVGMLACLYMWAFIDRSALANANIAGMSHDLELNVSNRYSVVAMIFFVGYILIDLPTNYLVSKVGATLWIPSIVCLWGVITIGQGFVHSWGALLACRFLLGLCEGGLIPSAIYLIGEWYTRYEAHARIAAFYVIGITATGLSGLLAYGIEKMEGTAGIAGWSWIFIIEGIATCACGLVAYVVLLELPDKSTTRTILRLPAFLTESEGALIKRRLENDRGELEMTTPTWKSMLKSAADWKVWEFSLYVLLNNTALYAFSYFLPIILHQGLHYSTAKAQLFTFPPYAVAAVWIMFVAWLCDKFHLRGPFMIFNCCLYTIGTSLMAFHDNVHVRYGGVFLGVIGIAGNVPSNFAYAHNNIVGRPKRALCAALMTIGGAVGGIISGNIFQAQDAPVYRTGIIICLVFQGLNVVLIAKNFLIFGMRNRQAEKSGLLLEGSVGFRYTY
ncbi:hypothetical protein M409DRAFT_30836 [Zasmidium cellare ATCC 36951]|uniref:Major facilitator superfamily (MFS) profile domain-containing protein n=1 Tax=Zasmidium cellare ATCC 36951 TaxID=1080233 RepID=A0A6A6BVV2_ZASCE|nr:uncharacterized protein M409DRAFT_30836 [Zasmidium cellare ATCC 36951]KAF2158673.1 hypothetical protein M409DRAFT_30836 [Zasmidium cellare ATCC 36951]